MLDQRIGIALSDDVNDRLTTLCTKYQISKGAFVSAMMDSLSQVARENAIATYKETIEAQREEKKAKRKELNKKVKSLTPEEIEMVLAARNAA